MKKWNHYICDTCGKTTIARHDDEGVTPFMIGCRVGRIKGLNATAPGCNGTAQSTFFEGSQEDNQVPHVIFFRPDAVTAIDFINKEPKKDRAWLLDHYQKGGSLMKDAE